MELHQLRCFVMVAEELHFGKAAKRLFMTQPPLSRQIQMLERSLGVTLLERSNKSVQLTVAGQHFLRDARHVLAYTEQAGTAARRLARGEAGHLHVGFTAVSGYSLIPGLLGHSAEQLPNVGFELHEMVSGAQTEALGASMIDVGFVRRAAPHLGFDSELIRSERLLVAMCNTHPLAQRKTVKMSELDRQPFIMYSPDEGRYFYDCIVGLFAMAGVAPQYQHYLGQTHSILGLVRAGLGIAIVPAAARELYLGNLHFCLIEDEQPLAEIYMVSRKDNDNPVLQPFLRMALDYFRSIG